MPASATMAQGRPNARALGRSQSLMDLESRLGMNPREWVQIHAHLSPEEIARHWKCSRQNVYVLMGKLGFERVASWQPVARE